MIDSLLCVGERIAPGITELDEAGHARVSAMIQHALDRRRPALRRQLAIFLAVLRWSPVLRYGRRFDRLTPARQDAVLRWFHDAPLAPLRQGFWGVRTLIYMGYYGRPEVAEAIGYRPSRTGNAFLHGP
ncbi:MAG: hypothetical protein A3H96_26535 [Acidobacteria bacterium RIFCSPLOWO2_02_FULL_67_36]|nr:MAG: hypothetical protein A3H96_26535 [Acidobacteria bacterium RIFCSPLOWO2_02_FULL_67_36]OFW26229.1 MAG: hypothetical protein A3G21_20860 [Acidobacteria bacterium RIFCSPLOWO2_12_FULL_66_21]